MSKPQVMLRPFLTAVICAGLISCGGTSKRIAITKSLSPIHAIGLDERQHLYGFWTGTLLYHDGIGLPYDTMWTLQMKNPKYLAYDDRFLLLRNTKGKTVIMSTTLEGRSVYKSTRSEERYHELRTELGVPENLVLQEIK